MDECGKRIVGEKYDHSLGQGYYLADADEEVPSDVNAIARSEVRILKLRTYMTYMSTEFIIIKNPRV